MTEQTDHCICPDEEGFSPADGCPVCDPLIRSVVADQTKVLRSLASLTEALDRLGRALERNHENNRIDPFHHEATS